MLAAWYTAATTRARRRAGAAAFVAVASSILRRRACARWASQAAASTLETGQTAIALEYGYDRCLRVHLRAWSALVSERRVLHRGVELLLRGRRVAATATGFRLWRRRTAEVRETGLRSCRIKVCVEFWVLPVGTRVFRAKVLHEQGHVKTDQICLMPASPWRKTGWGGRSCRIRLP